MTDILDRLKSYRDANEAGGYGETDNNLLPQYMRIVPTYGAGWERLYEKPDKTISLEGS